MSSKYKFDDRESVYFVTSTVVDWIDVFTPLTKNFPFYSPYQFAGNSPIRNIDLDGGEPQDFVVNWKPRNIFNPKSGVSNGNTISVYDAKLGRNLSVEGVYDNWTKQTWFIHEDNQGNYYYLKNLNGDNQTLRYTSDPSHTLVGGQFEKFETQDETQRKNVNKFLDDFSLAFAGGITAVAAAPVALEALVPASEYLAPKLGFNAAGAAWDLFNQKVIKGESWENINVASIITAGSFGGGSTFSNALFGSSGSFLNLSYNNISQGKNLLNFNKAGVVGFSSSFAGGLFAGGTSAFFKSANQTAITNPLTRSIMNYVLSNTMEATGQMGANIIESKLSHK